MQLNHNQGNAHVAIVGAGLSGLLLGHLLNKNNIHCTVFEAAAHIGGRIQTIRGPGGVPLEFGATWFSDAHPRLKYLLNELGLSSFPQHTEGLSLFHAKAFVPPQQFYIPQADAPPYRITGGTSKLITTLASLLPQRSILTGKPITAIADDGQKITLTSAQGENYNVSAVAICLPPKLAEKSISFSPELPSDVKATIGSVHTWMAGSTKFVVEYPTPFWREKGYSGVLYAHTGLVNEMYDQSDAQVQRFGLAGFLSPNATKYSRGQRRELVLEQLAAYFGEEAKAATYYNDKIWTGDFVTPDGPPSERPHQNNGHPHLHAAYMDQKLYFSGSETSTSHPGYLEGAVTAAETTARNITERLLRLT